MSQPPGCSDSDWARALAASGGAEEFAAGQAAIQQSVAGQSATNQSGAGQSAIDKSAAGQGAIDQSVAGQSAINQSAAGQKAIDQSAAGHPDGNTCEEHGVVGSHRHHTQSPAAAPQRVFWPMTQS